MKRFALVTLVIFTAAAAIAAPLSESESPRVRRTLEPVADSFIVVFKDDAAFAFSKDQQPSANATVARQLTAGYDVAIGRVYGHALNGFSARMSAITAERLARDPRVAYIEQDGVVRATTTQTGATWGLDRTDQRSLPLSGAYSYSNTGSGVKAYIIDTGVLATHAEFGTRVVAGYTAISDGRGTTDCNGHGTHVAGTVGGTTYGVAKSVTLVPVRVLDCGGSGTNSGVIAGVDWVTGNHAAGAPAVANMSLGGGASSALDAAVNNSINDGVTYAVAAGNGNIIGIAQDACKYSPARVANAITIGATDKADKKASWSNYGNCVDFFAAGVSITSAWYTSNTATNTISGTSMATPHVAGVAALYLQSFPGASPAAVRDALYANTTKSIVTSSKTTNNHLLYSNY